MGRYRKIEVGTWTDDKFMELSPLPPSGQSLWLYILTGPHTGPIPGLFVCGKAAMAEALNWEPEAFEEAFREVFGKGMLKFDQRTKLWWLPHAIEYNMPESPNVVRSWGSQVDILPGSKLLTEAISVLRERICTGEGFAKAFDQAFGKALTKAIGEGTPRIPGKAMPNQEQEQEQEQKKETPVVPFADRPTKAPVLSFRKSPVSSDFGPTSFQPQDGPTRYHHTPEDINAFFATWNACGLPEFRKLLLNIPNAGELREALSFYTAEEITSAIKAYATVLTDPDYDLGFRYQTVVNFLTKGLDAFAPGAKPLETYAKRSGTMTDEQKAAEQVRRVLSMTTTEHHEGAQA